MISGSKNEKNGRRAIGPFGKATESAMNFCLGITTVSTFHNLANRIEVLEAIMKLPVVASGSTSMAYATRQRYEQEMDEIEDALGVFCALPDAPEA